MWVKICGITNREDAITAIGAGADALGFNLWPGSKRHIRLDENAAWIGELPPGVERVAVLVDVPISEALRIAENPAIDAVQFHGNESANYLAEFARSGYQMLVACRLEDEPGLRIPVSERRGRILLDANVSGSFGGTGVTVDLHRASEFVKAHSKSRVILAGGLTPANVADAVDKVHPFGVDVASGVERLPGAKDAEKVRAFIRAVS